MFVVFDGTFAATGRFGGNGGGTTGGGGTNKIGGGEAHGTGGGDVEQLCGFAGVTVGICVDGTIGIVPRTLLAEKFLKNVSPSATSIGLLLSTVCVGRS